MYYRDKKILSWALYDWANSSFATTVMAGFLPIMFKDFWQKHAAEYFGFFNLVAKFASIFGPMVV